MKTALLNTEFLQHQHQLYAYILGLVKQEDVAKELIQELYIKLHKNRKKLEAERVRFYFFRAAKNSCMDWFRQNNRIQQVEFSLEHETGTQ